MTLFVSSSLALSVGIYLLSSGASSLVYVTSTNHPIIMQKDYPNISFSKRKGQVVIIFLVKKNIRDVSMIIYQIIGLKIIIKKETGISQFKAIEHELFHENQYSQNKKKKEMVVGYAEASFMMMNQVDSSSFDDDKDEDKKPKG